MKRVKRSLAKTKNRPRMRFQPVPTEKDWGDYKSDLDQNYAHSVFAGRTNQETQPFFRRNPIERTDELRWMPEVPFRYYMLGFRDFIRGKEFDFLWAADAASCFLGLILEKLEQQPRCIIPIMPELLPAIEHVVRNQALFEAKESIYENFLVSEAIAHSKPLRTL
jgi:hypothetical protein